MQTLRTKTSSPETTQPLAARLSQMRLVASETTSHPILTDLEAVKVLAGAPAALDLFMWLSYRCFVASGQESIPLFGSAV